MVVFLVALLAFAALSIDVSNVFHHQRNEQAATDAGAFAAVALLTTNPPANSKDNIIAEARAITAANGVATNEITASNYGTIQVGHWDGTNFTADVAPTNAVLVPAKRNVPLAFGKIVGLAAMNPAVHSIASMEGLGCLTNVIPFGVTTNELVGKGVGDTMALNDSAVGSGKQGKIDLVGYKNTPEWDDDMLALGCGGCQTCVGSIEVITGNAHIDKDFNAMAGSIFTMPIIDHISFSGGSATANIVGFVLVRLDSSSGNGSGWTASVTFLTAIPTGPGGGSCPPPCLQTRVLVQ